MAEWFKAPVLKTGMGASPSWVRIPLSPPVKPPSSSYPGIILIDHEPALTDALRGWKWAAPTRAPTQAVTDYRRRAGETTCQPGHSADLVLMLETAQLLGGPPQRRFINPLCGCGSSVADPPAPIDPPTI